MREVDLPEVMRNEQAAYSHPWTLGTMQDCLRVGYCCLVVSLDQALIGHAVLSVGAGEAQLLNLCVAPPSQSRGVGRLLLKRLLRIAAERQVDTLFLEVRSSNQAAIKLYQSEGFNEIGLRRGYYPVSRQRREDAVIYAKPFV